MIVGMTAPADADCGDERARSALACYDIGMVRSLDRLAFGHPAVRKVIATRGTYLLKPPWRRADVELLAQLPALGRFGIRQPQIITTRSGQLVSPDGYYLQEFLAGEPELHPSGGQVRAVMRAAGSLHVALGRLPVRYQPDPGSVFVQVTDPGFLIAELPALLGGYGMATAPAGAAIACLAEHQAALSELPRQLVHGDIGPDNVLLDGEQVVAIIDFTPQVLPVLFAASTALYWYHVYGQPAVPMADLDTSRTALAEARPWSAAEDMLWIPGLVWESLRRLATTLELARRTGTDPPPTAGTRLSAVRAIATALVA